MQSVLLLILIAGVSLTLAQNGDTSLISAPPVSYSQPADGDGVDNTSDEDEDNDVLDQEMNKIQAAYYDIVSTYKALGSFHCFKEALHDTRQLRVMQRDFKNRSITLIESEYLNSYGPEERGRGQLNRMSIESFTNSLDDSHLIRRYAEYVAFSYCRHINLISSKSGLNFRVGNFAVLRSGFDHKHYVMYYITYNQEQNVIVVAFRGSVTFRDTLDDLRGRPLIPEPSILSANLNESDINQSQIHYGFWKRFTAFRESLTNDLTSVLATTPCKNLVVVGHSLGAVWAFLQAADWVQNQHISVAGLYLFGMPKFANQIYVDALASVIGPEKILRIVNRDDIVPHLGMADAVHPTLVNEYYIDEGTNVIRRCNGGHDETCSRKIPCERWTWANHTALGDWSIRRELCRLDKAVPQL